MNIEKTIRMAGAYALAVVLVLTVICTESYAAQHDAREDVSTDTATITLGKELTYINRKKNPVQSVTYTIEKVQAWENNNVKAKENGKEMAVSSMPEPSSSSVSISLTDEGNGTAQGTSDITIKFTKAGYYVYRIKEIPISQITGAVVTSDSHEYFAVIYVCNKTDKDGNTVPGVYVHDITSYRNESGSSSYKPALTDIANITDNGGQAARENIKANLGKVGKSTPSDPDGLDAYKMWNQVEYPEPIDLKVTNNVTGTLGDLTKEFEFTIELSGLEESAEYVTYGTGKVEGTQKRGIWNNSVKTMTTDDTGKITMTVLLKDDEDFTIEDLPKGSSWSITETANNHKASYEVTPSVSAVTAKKANEKDNTDLDAGGTANQDTVADFVNTRDLTVMTGVPSENMPYFILAAIFMVMAAVYAFLQRPCKHGRR